ncbi:MAG: L-2-hydroxyglutarate oxidase, partial [Planctomycetota bacterium]
MNADHDFVVVGAGIVGLATALRLTQRMSDCRVLVLEAEPAVARHQSGHNSGVIHSGIYYQPGSQKALTCRNGKSALESFCDQYGVPRDACGKVIVATRQHELESLDRIAQRGRQNGAQFTKIDTDTLRELEPNAAGIAALHVPETGIVDYTAVCQRMKDLILERGGQVVFDFTVTKIDSIGDSIRVTDQHGTSYSAGRLINCAGLQSDRICRLAGGTPEVQIVPFRGEYYELAPAATKLVNHLIYPVPDPAFPFLGVHFTRMIGGGVECGPNAVLALSREGYDWKSIRMRDLLQTISFAGFQKLAARHWRTGIGEIHRSLRKPAFLRALQKLMPTLKSADL